MKMKAAIAKLLENDCLIVRAAAICLGGVALLLIYDNRCWMISYKSCISIMRS